MDVGIAISGFDIIWIRLPFYMVINICLLEMLAHTRFTVWITVARHHFFLFHSSYVMLVGLTFMVFSFCFFLCRKNQIHAVIASMLSLQQQESTKFPMNFHWQIEIFVLFFHFRMNFCGWCPFRFWLDLNKRITCVHRRKITTLILCVPLYFCRNKKLLSLLLLLSSLYIVLENQMQLSNVATGCAYLM